MKKIIMITDSLEKKETLIEYLHALFPGCEIEIQYKQAKISKDFPVHTNEYPNA